MRRNVIETIMGAVVLLVAVAFIVFAFRTSGLTASGGYRVIAEFNDASGLDIGTDVRVAGVKVGTVVEQDLDPKSFRAAITMEIGEDILLPSDSSARILPDGLLGGNYVELQIGAEDLVLAEGGRISLTQDAINVVELISRIILQAAQNSESSSE